LGLKRIDRLLDLDGHAAGVLAGRIRGDRGGQRLVDATDPSLGLDLRDCRDLGKRLAEANRQLLQRGERVELAVDLEIDVGGSAGQADG